MQSLTGGGREIAVEGGVSERGENCELRNAEPDGGGDVGGGKAEAG